jgi:zinc D-Ala-D-Ala carboxypeptidase
MTEFYEDRKFEPLDLETECAKCGQPFESHRVGDLACPVVDEASAEGELPEGYLTEHFTLAEMIASDTATACGIDNTPTPEIVDNLTRLCDVLEEIRTLCGDNTVTVSSGYRCEALNAEVGGVSDSAHLFGLGADITIPGYGDPTAICKNIEPYLAQLGIDQLIDETGGGARWVHVGLCEGAPRNQCFAL